MPTKPKPRRAKKSYHHGNLRQVLIETTLQLVAEVGPENVTLRTVAKLAGVSSGAPFRHFADRCALMTAVAEDAQLRLQEEIAASLEKAKRKNPLLRFRAIGEAYLRWAIRNPSHFKVISDRRLINFEGSASLVRSNEELLAEMTRLLTEAHEQGLLPGIEVAQFLLAGRALVYGLSRRFSDGHFPSMGLDERHFEEIGKTALDVLFRPVR